MIGIKNRTDIVILSTEDKPTEGLENGSTCYEVDTGVLYIYYKGTWYEQSDDMTPTSNNEEQSNNETRAHTKEDDVIEPIIFEPIIKGDENEENK